MKVTVVTRFPRGVSIVETSVMVPLSSLRVRTSRVFIDMSPLGADIDIVVSVTRAMPAGRAAGRSSLRCDFLDNPGP